MADNTIFDSVFKTMVHKAPRLLIPFVNEVFGRDYPEDCEVMRFNSEHESGESSKFDDSVFRLGDRVYHVECQSTADADMVVRMIEYDFQIALEEALRKGRPYRLAFPASCVLYLRHTSTTPDVLTMEVELPDGRSFDYEVKVLKAQLIGKDELFEKRLLILLPYYLMRYERRLARMSGDGEEVSRLVEECVDLGARLAEATIERGDSLLYEQLTELIIRISDYLTRQNADLQRKVRAAMGGVVLELADDRARRMVQEAKEQGKEQGVDLGMDLGVDLGMDKFADALRGLGADEGLIAEAMRMAREQVDQSRDHKTR